MRTWFLMAVAGVSIVAGASSQGSAGWMDTLTDFTTNFTKGFSCQGTCTQSLVKNFWQSPSPALKQKLVGCLECRSGANNFTTKLQGLMESEPRSSKTAFVCAEVAKNKKYYHKQDPRFPYAEKIYDESCGRWQDGQSKTQVTQAKAQPLGAYSAQPAMSDSSGEMEDGSPDQANFMPDDMEQ